jgi:hypothetical protein
LTKTKTKTKIKIGGIPKKKVKINFFWWEKLGAWPPSSFLATLLALIRM